MAFFNPTYPLNTELTFEDQQFGNILQDYSDTTIYSMTKCFLLDFFIQNFSKNERAPKISTTFWHYTRPDHLEDIAVRIINCNTPNLIYFIQKTSVSGRAINTLVKFINDTTNHKVTELTNISLALQDNQADPVRAYKIERTDGKKQYAIIGNKHMTQKVQYMCLGLTPVLFPELLKDMDETKLNAFKSLCQSIGRMDAEKYETNLHACIALCETPTLAEIDYTSIDKLLNKNIQARIDKLRDEQYTEQTKINSALHAYEEANKALQKITWELSKLTTESQDDDHEKAIQIAKNFKSIVAYTYNNGEHAITIRSKMLLESDAIVKRIVDPTNYNAHEHYGIHSGSARRLLEDLWVNKTLQLDFCTTFTKYGSDIIPTCTPPTHPRLKRNTIPNPHLIHYACYGDNKRQLIDAHQNNNLEYYLGILTSSNSNLNTGDATVLIAFCKDVLQRYVNEKILYDVENKTYVSPNERMKYYETV